MLKISVEETGNSFRLILEGKLMGPWVDELQRLCHGRDRLRPGMPMTVDLCGLTAMDSRGHAALEDLFRRGAVLLCSDVMNRYLVEQMAQPERPIAEAYRPCQSNDPTRV